MLGKAIVGAAILVLMVSALVVAQENEASSWELKPYVWFSSLNGKVGVFKGLPAADVDLDFGDIWDVTDIGLMVATERRFTDKWAYVGDLAYLKLSDEATAPAPVSGKLSVDITMSISQPSVAYRIVEGEDYWLDLMGGLRIWNIKSELKAKTGPMAGTKFDDKELWIDPNVGFRVAKELGERWSVMFRGDVGGFDLGSTSQFSWQAVGGFGYAITEKVDAWLLYRHLDVDYDEGGWVFDAYMQGLLAGVGFTF